MIIKLSAISAIPNECIRYEQSDAIILNISYITCYIINDATGDITGITH